MASRGLYVVCALCCVLMIVTDAVYLPKTRGLAAAEALKRSVQTGARQKRYTDYQERASAFCTGLCMYEERKSYSDCFDLCNWNYGYSSPGSGHNEYQDYDEEPKETAQYPSAPVPDSDYSNDQATPGIISKQQANRKSKGKNKGKKGKSKSKSPKKTQDAQLAKQKQILKDLKRKLMQEIGQKEDQLSERALHLQAEIQNLEDQISNNKQTIGQLQDRLQGISLEMGNIEELRTNVTQLVKDRRKMLSGKTSDGFSESFLLPESQFSDHANLSNVIKEFLVQDKTKRSSEESENQLSSDVESDFNGEVRLHNKQLALNNAASNLEELLAADGYMDLVV